MTSLNTTSGWNAKKEIGSNLTTRRINQGSGAVGGATREQRRHLLVEEEKGKPTTSGGAGGGGGGVVRATTTPSVTSSVGSTSRGGGGVGGAVSQVSSLSPPLSEEEVMRERELFYKEKYDYMTGVRIASTLGGFFLLVLLTLLYKSKCKGKHSREPSTLNLNNIPYPTPHHPPIQAAHHHLTLMRGQNIQVNGRSHHYHDFGGGGSPGGGGGGFPPTMTLLDSSGYGYMNQVHPANSHQPSVFSSNNCYSSTRSAGTHMKNPAVLLITAANSESSDEELSELISPLGGPGGGFMGEVVEIQPPPRQEVERRRSKSGLGAGPPGRQGGGGDRRSKSPPTIVLGPGGGGGGGAKGNIDINVILPTPSISPSGSENFNVGGGCGQYFGGGATSLFPSIRERASGGGPPSGGASGRGRLLVSRSLSSENENDQSELSGGGDEGGGGGDPLSECSSNISNEEEEGGDTSTSAPPVPFGCGASSLFSLDNLKYVDDTSSENIPTRGSEEDGEDDKEEDTRSIGSDSVFACFEHNFDHVAPSYARRVSSVSGTSPYPGSSPLPPPKHHKNWTHSHHHHHHQRYTSPHRLHHHHHHHHSSIHPPPPPPPPPQPPIPIIHQPPEDPAPATSEDLTTTPSGAGEFRVTLTQAQAQVHHRTSDSFCSDIESINDYLETEGAGGRRRSSSTQTTLSDIRQALGYTPLIGHIAWSSAGGGGGCGVGSGDFNGGGEGATSPGTISLTSADHRSARRLSVPRRRRSLSPHLNPPCAHLALSPRNSTSVSTSTSQPPPPPQPPTSLPLHIPTANATTTTAQPEDFEEGEDDGPPENKMSPVITPTNPPPTLLVSPSSPFIPPRVMRKRSFDAVRKSLSLQCGENEKQAEQSSLYQVSSSNETTPTN